MYPPQRRGAARTWAVDISLEKHHWGWHKVPEKCYQYEVLQGPGAVTVFYMYYLIQLSGRYFYSHLYYKTQWP